MNSYLDTEIYVPWMSANEDYTKRRDVNEGRKFSLRRVFDLELYGRLKL